MEFPGPRIDAFPGLRERGNQPAVGIDVCQRFEHVLRRGQVAGQVGVLRVHGRDIRGERDPEFCGVGSGGSDDEGADEAGEHTGNSMHGDGPLRLEVENELLNRGVFGIFSLNYLLDFIK